jgi:hypothetical protein
MHIAYSQVDVRFKQYALGHVSVGPLRALSPAERVACINAAPCAVFARTADRFIISDRAKIYKSLLALERAGGASPPPRAGWQRKGHGARGKRGRRPRPPGAPGAGPRPPAQPTSAYGVWTNGSRPQGAAA